MKKFHQILLSLTLCAAMLCGCGASSGGASSSGSAAASSAAASSSGSAASSAETAEAVDVRVSALKGPTGMGLANLGTESSDGSGTTYTLTQAGAADEITPALIQGELDIACVPANLAAVLYQKTQGEVVTAAINTLGVLYIVEKSESVQSMADLKGQTIVAAGKGSTPEYALRYLLRESGIDHDSDVTLDWKSEHAECVSALASGAATIALLPQPFVTVAQSKIEGLRMALDLTAEWDALDNGSALLTGVAVVRKSFAQEHPAALEAFLADYAASVAWVSANTADAAARIGEMGIVDAAVAEKALPYCNIVCITGPEMKEKLAGYLAVLHDQEPKSTGGALPGDDFYYGA